MNQAMTSRERFLAAINQQDVDYMPTCGPFQGCWALGESRITVAECIAKPELGAQAQLKVIQACDFDGLEVMWDWLSPAEVLGCEIQMPEMGAPSHSKRRRLTGSRGPICGCQAAETSCTMTAAMARTLPGMVPHQRRATSVLPPSLIGTLT